MNETHESCFENSVDLQGNLERALKDHGGRDIVVNYKDVAFAFPSNAPNPDSFEYPLIDHVQLKQWAEAKGWQVKLAPEQLPEGVEHCPPVRFTRKL